jgi:hypothetical protein
VKRRKVGDGRACESSSCSCSSRPPDSLGCNVCRGKAPPLPRHSSRLATVNRAAIKQAAFASELSPARRDGVLGVENTGAALGKSSSVTMREWLFYHSVRHGPGQRLGSTPRRYSKENLSSRMDEACIEALLGLQRRASHYGTHAVSACENPGPHISSKGGYERSLSP